MTLLAYPGIVLSPDTIATDAGEGSFRAIGDNGSIPVFPHTGIGTYTILNFGISAPVFVFQGGGVSIY